MPVAYVEPLNRALADTRRILFRPFDLGKWLVIAFSAWLAGLASGGSGTGGPRWHGKGDRLPDIGYGVRQAWGWVHEHVLRSPLILVVVLVVIGAILLLIWISSRAKFVFLDNVVRDRGTFVEPWKRLARLGDSLFAWRLGFFAVAVAAMIAVAAVALAIAGGLPRHHELGGRGFAGIAFLLVAGVSVALVIAYVNLFLESFVIPVMYRDGITATAAWRRFGPLFDANSGAFILYGLFVLLLWIAVAGAVLLAGLFTCCVGFLVLALPYVGTVVLLPVLVAYRAYSLEFLAQLAPGYALLASAEPDRPDAD